MFSANSTTNDTMNTNRFHFIPAIVLLVSLLLTSHSALGQRRDAPSGQTNCDTRTDTFGMVQTQSESCITEVPVNSITVDLNANGTSVYTNWPSNWSGLLHKVTIGIWLGYVEQTADIEGTSTQTATPASAEVSLNGVHQSGDFSVKGYHKYQTDPSSSSLEAVSTMATVWVAIDP
jgi:hypothetical protein